MVALQKHVSVKVVNDEREVNKVVVEKVNTSTEIKSTSVIKDRTVNVEVIALDQYGDPIDETVQAVIGNKEIIEVE